MREEIQQLKEIKEYLLGFASHEEAMEKVEERLMTDEEYHKEMLAAEEELIQNYVDGELSVTEKAAFERHFLLSDERRERIEFARAFREYVDEQKAPAIPVKPKKKFSFAEWFAFSPAIRIPMASAATLLIVLASFFGWNAYNAYSQKQQSLALLNRAYKNGRPLESRITEFDYADFNKLRGKDESQVDKLALDRANMTIKEKADENPNLTNLMLLARLYLTQKDFDGAIQQLERARTLDPNNAEIFNDLGVAAFEKGLLQTDPGARTELIGQANEYFDSALKTDKGLREALFNKARCLENLNLVNQAKEYWREYLKYDSTSRWAVEAKTHLDDLEKLNSESMSSDGLEQAFLSAVRSSDADEAFRLASQNRELIAKQYLPQKLAMSLVEASGERKAELLRGLAYLGELEKEKNKDNYASDLAELYRDLPNDKIEILKKAQSAVREGYELCLKDNFSQAHDKFTEARELFLQGGNVIEAKSICDYFIAYCLFNSDRRQEGYESFTQVDAFYTEKHYEWFSLMNQDWLVGSREALKYSSSSETTQKCEAGLEKAESMRDIYMTQKFLKSLLNYSMFDGQDKKIFAYIGRVIEYSGMPGGSLRQKERGFDGAFKKLAPRFAGLSLAVLGEGILMGEALKDPLFVIYREKNAGKVYTQIGDFPAAEKWLMRAKESVFQIEEKTRQNQELSDIYYKLGNLERQKADYNRAVQYYDSALDIQKSLNTQLQLYEIKKSKLLAYQALGDDDRIESELPETIQLVEGYRKKLTSEQERNIFFSNEQEVYDIAIEHKVRTKQYEEAYNYAEVSNPRSLLNSLQRNSDAPVDQYNGEVFSPDSSQPLKLREIQEQMPSGVQILQYSVLGKKVLIWLISKETFLPLESEISSPDLNKKVDNYLGLIKTKDREKQDQAKKGSSELYDLLIKPAAPYLDKNKDICLIRNKSLFYLPFSSLQSPESRVFIKDFSFFYSSSASVFIMSTREAVKRNSSSYERVLSVGNPDFDKKKLPDLADISESTDEARVISGYYHDPKILLEKGATKSAFLNAVKDYEVINFASHYVINTASPSLSQLVMARISDNDSDNFLTNAELMREKLPLAKLVVLSACQTGAEGDFKGEGSVGLTRTFLALGVPLVVASSWPVDSKATAELIKKFHYYRKLKNLSSVHALRQAQLDMIDAAGGKFSDPYYWAAFAAFGGYAEF